MERTQFSMTVASLKAGTMIETLGRSSSRVGVARRRRRRARSSNQMDSGSTSSFTSPNTRIGRPMRSRRYSAPGTADAEAELNQDMGVRSCAVPEGGRVEGGKGKRRQHGVEQFRGPPAVRAEPGVHFKDHRGPVGTPADIDVDRAREAQ